MSPLIYSCAPDFIAAAMSDPPEPPHIAIREIVPSTGLDAFMAFRLKRSFTNLTASSAVTHTWKFPWRNCCYMHKQDYSYVGK